MHAARGQVSILSRLGDWHQGLPVPPVRLLEQVGGGTMFHLLDDLTMKNFFLKSSLPFITFTFRLSVATLVSLSPSHAFSNHAP